MWQSVTWYGSFPDLLPHHIRASKSDHSTCRRGAAIKFALARQTEPDLSERGPWLVLTFLQSTRLLNAHQTLWLHKCHKES